MNKILILLFLVLTLNAEDIDLLLSELAQKDDLSQETKKEKAGYLTIYTRADLDQMRVKNLAELIDQIPFMRYMESREGLTDPLYNPLIPDTGNTIRIYIDDRELFGAYTGNGLQLYAQYPLDYIDHIEVYMGIPSLEFGITPSFVTIKCYTKDPSRESATVVGGFGGSYGAKRLYAYTADVYNGYAYLIDASADDAKRKKVTANNRSFSRDKTLYNLYAKVQKDDFRFNMQLSQAETDLFLGQSFRFDSIDPHASGYDIHFNLSYNNKDAGIESLISYSEDSPDTSDLSQTPGGLGFYIAQLPSGTTIPVPYTSRELKTNEKLYNAKFLKTFQTERNTLTLGAYGRRQHVTYDTTLLDGRPYLSTLNYSDRDTLTLSAEESFLINRSNIVTASYLHTNIQNNSTVKNYVTNTYRIGYIYNSKHITSKTFYFDGKNAPSMRTLYLNRAIFAQQSDPDAYRQRTLSTKLTYKAKNYKTSLLAARSVMSDIVYLVFDPVRFTAAYKNAPYDTVLDSISYRFDYTFNAQNRLSFNAWVNYTETKDLNKKSHTSGGYITLFNKVGKFSFYNNITYKHSLSLGNGYNVNSTINYAYSRNLEFYLKGNNIFNKALSQNYTSYDPLSGSFLQVDNIEPIDQSFLVGLEYQF